MHPVTLNDSSFASSTVLDDQSVKRPDYEIRASNKRTTVKISPPKELSIEIPPDDYSDLRSQSEAAEADQKLTAIEE